MLSGINILVVEDNLLNQKIVSFILQKQKANVKMAFNGREAIDILGKGGVDIILMDLQMPEMDGYEAIKHIRGPMKSNLPIIALTAGLIADESEECRRIGANECITKPLDPVGICNMILSFVRENKA